MDGGLFLFYFSLVVFRISVVGGFVGVADVDSDKGERQGASSKLVLSSMAALISPSVWVFSGVGVSLLCSG